MNNSIIGAVLSELNMKPGTFAKAIGVHPTQVYDLQSGKTKNISGDMADKITDVFPQFNKAFLRTGEGEMLKSQAKPAKTLSKTEGNRIPLIPASAFAGGVSGFAPETLDPRNCEMVVSPVAGAEFAIPITGDSMEPEYPDGSLAYIKRINEMAFIPWGHTVILDTENGAFIKRIYPDTENEKYVWAKSINPAYPPMHVPKSSIFRIFRVLGTSRIFTTM